MNVASLTESELLSIADVLGMILWRKYFIQAHAYTIESNMLYKDTKSTIFLSRNGWMSAKKNNEHIKNHFFLISDKVPPKDAETLYMGTQNMWVGINIKPVQGNQFRIFHSEIKGISVEYNNDV
jgi:hypothetical protein